VVIVWPSTVIDTLPIATAPSRHFYATSYGNPSHGQDNATGVNRCGFGYPGNLTINII
jgi:hypothetical protein